MSGQLDGGLVLLAVPAAGNEPNLLAVAIAKQINVILSHHGVQPGKIVVPAVNANVRRVLESEHGSDLADVFLDEKSGRIIEQLLATQGDFRAHIQYVVNNHDRVDSEMLGHFGKAAKQFHAYSLREGNEVLVSTANVVTLDIAPRWSVRDANSSHFIFPVLISELIDAAISANLDFDLSDMRAFQNVMRSLEQRYSNVFVPKIGTLSACALSGLPPNASLSTRYSKLVDQPTSVGGQSIIYTPGLGRGDVTSLEASTGLDSAIYSMFSGTGSAIAETRALVADLIAQGQPMFVPEWINNIEGSIPRSPSVIFHPDVRAVIGRSGWGTLWKTIRAQKPFLAVPYRNGDDPEIFFNDITLERMGVGAVLARRGYSLTDIADVISSIGVNLKEINALTKGEFGTTDGVAYVANMIAKTILGDQS